ncbi:MAG: hypothetical protein EAX95_15140 [Candidatus Thorarchaeota archaeon]|nr:hypothetical protein [Candidatus Thorarchaeota archaeon]
MYLFVTISAILDPNIPLTFYGETDPPWIELYYIGNTIGGLFLWIGLVSLGLLIINQVRAVYWMSSEEFRYKLKIGHYIEMLEEGKTANASEIMGYDTFYASLKPIGSYLQRIALGIVFVVSTYAINLMTFSFLRDLMTPEDLGFLGLGSIGLSLLLLLWTQYGLHILLRERKEENLNALLTKRDILNSELMLEALSKSRGDNGAGISSAGLEIELLPRVQSAIDSLKPTSTWGLGFIDLLEFLVTAAVPLILWISQFFVFLASAMP